MFFIRLPFSAVNRNVVEETDKWKCFRKNFDVHSADDCRQYCTAVV
jgi:hypothetical protein